MKKEILYKHSRLGCLIKKGRKYKYRKLPPPCVYFFPFFSVWQSVKADKAQFSVSYLKQVVQYKLKRLHLS